MEMSLASAFRYRNKIKKLLNRVSSLLRDLKVAVEEEDFNRQNGLFTTGSYDGDVQLVLSLKDLLKTVNVAIDGVNFNAREILNEINASKEKIDFLECICSNISTTKLYKVDSYGYAVEERLRVTLIPLYDKKWQEELNDERRHLNRCENQLSDFNGKQRVSFEVSDHLKKIVETA